MKIVGQKRFGPGDFSVGLVNEALAMLCKSGFTPEMLKRVADLKSGMAEKFVNLFPKAMRQIVDVYESIRRDWEKFYENNFNLKVDFSALRIPKCPGSGWRLLFIAQGIGSEQAFQISKQVLRKAWKYYDASLDVVIVKNERSNKDGAYAIWVRDGQEAEEIHKNKSANQIEAEKLLTETGLERLVHGLKYFRETGKQLDVKTVTLCSGSRGCDGGVPSVGWHDIYDELSVDDCSPDGANDCLRAREVSC